MHHRDRGGYARNGRPRPPSRRRALPAPPGPDAPCRQRLARGLPPRAGAGSRSPAQTDQGLRVKTVILAGGLGTRLAEETDATPKPMVEIGGSPILWHIMKIYSSAGFSEFVLALGYRAEVVKRYFLDYYRL